MTKLRNVKLISEDGKRGQRPEVFISAEKEDGTHVLVKIDMGPVCDAFPAGWWGLRTAINTLNNI